MNPLFAHHIEPQHIPVLAAFLGVGFWLGWHAVSKLLAWRMGSHQRPEVGP
jgi:hypothetical protein